MGMMRFMGIVSLCCAGTMCAAQGSAKLDKVLAQMDAASAKFTSAQADVERDQFDHLVKEHTINNGSIYVLRERNGATEMATKLGNPGAQIVEYKAGKVRRYQLGLKCVETYSASPSSVDSFLTLGFGGSGADLKKNWNITDLGTEKIDGLDVEKLDLVGKEQSVRNNFTHVTLWIDLSKDVSLKQEFFTSSGDTQTATYTNIKVNQPIDRKPYQFSGGSCGK